MGQCITHMYQLCCGARQYKAVNVRVNVLQTCYKLCYRALQYKAVNAQVIEV